MKLSIVLITRNQEWNIARLVESVVGGTVEWGTRREVLLVDSASTDGTASTATRYPVGVVVLSDDQRLTAAAGRWVGFRETSGDYVLFLDGDMKLIPHWAQLAIEVLDAHPSIAAVTGIRIDLPIDASTSDQMNLTMRATRDRDTTFTDVTHGGGATMYRRSSLERVGSFNPFLFSDEEPELCIRLRYAGGYRVVRLEQPHVFHFTDPVESFSNLVARARRKLFFGAGQNIRQHWHSPILRPYLRERGFGLVPGLGLVAGASALVYSVITRNPVWIGGWTLILMVVTSLDALRKRSIRTALWSLLQRVLIVVGTVRGFLMSPRDPDTHAGAFTRVQ